MDTTGRHPSTTQAVRGLEYGHLPHNLQMISKPLHDTAEQMLLYLPDDPELTAGLRKLREAKDCFVLLAAHLDGALRAEQERLNG